MKIHLDWTLILGLALLASCNGDDSGEETDESDTDTDTDTDADTDPASACPDGVVFLSGTLTEDTTLTADCQWVLRGGVFVGDDVNETILTVEAGTTVYGETSTGGMLVVTRGSKLIAEGTKDAPIVFTSSKSPGSRARGDWGGLIINGRAPINSCEDTSEGPCEAFGEGGTGWYGGDDPNDSSGSLKYVRVEFAGTLISPDNELNGIGFQGVGAGTTVDYVQVHMNDDDGVEFFGGTVTWKHILVTGVSDDMLDWTDGWTGKGQFFVGQQYADASDNGIEGDNNADNNEATPLTQPWLSHVTLIGSPDSSASDLGLLLREGTGGHIYNVVATGFNEACIDVDHDATFANATAGDLELESSLFACAKTAVEDDGEPNVADWLDAAGNDIAADAGLTKPYDQAAPDYRPTSSSPAASGGQTPGDAFFTTAAFRGGVDPNDDWTAGWTTHEAN
jgi:hypothetical protein